ncbi:MAG: DMP19 family protein [Azoarcus sp.]|jgi:DNA-binding transcriptional regulator GbsR (MarR family)|nr:DMP19 family protein [Azoarcus sp.]
MKALPKIKSKEIEKAEDDSWDFLYVFLNEYFEMIDKNKDIMKEFNDFQHTLLAYCYLDSQVCNGGFIQLIQNGYGGYIFNNPFSDAIKSWGAEETAKIVEAAKVIYKKHKEKLETETSLDEFSELYSDIKDFEPLEDEYYKIKEQEVEKVKKYVEEHINDFGIIE